MVSRCIPAVTSTKCMAIILENLSYQLGHAHGARHCDSIVFLSTCLFCSFSYLHVYEHVEVCGERLRPQHRRTRWRRLRGWIRGMCLPSFKLFISFFLRKTLNESCLPCEITGLLSWMAEGRPCIYCRHLTFPKTILQLLPPWPCLWMAARQRGRK